MLDGYFIIKKYTEVIKNYPLFFTFAKHNKLWKYIYPRWKYDAYQIIALSCLIPGSLKEKNNFLQRELYHFYNHVVVSYRLPRKQRKKHKKYTPDYKNHCDICDKEKKEYMYKSLYPGKTVCKECYKKHKRKYVDPNYCRKKK